MKSNIRLKVKNRYITWIMLIVISNGIMLFRNVYGFDIIGDIIKTINGI